jgi:hypothetical protein
MVKFASLFLPSGHEHGALTPIRDVTFYKGSKCSRSSLGRISWEDLYASTDADRMSKALAWPFCKALLQ